MPASTSGSPAAEALIDAWGTGETYDGEERWQRPDVAEEIEALRDALAADVATADRLTRENARLRQALLAYMAWSERMWQETDRGWDDETSWFLSREEYDQASAALAGDDSNVCNEGAGKAGGKPMKT